MLLQALERSAACRRVCSMQGVQPYSAPPARVIRPVDHRAYASQPLSSMQSAPLQRQHGVRLPFL